MKRLLAFAALIVMAVALVSSGSASMLNASEKYAMGLSMLRAYLSRQGSAEISPDGKTPLEQIIQTFQEAAGHAEVNGFLFYAMALDQLDKEQFDIADLYIDLLQDNDGLNALLADKDFIQQYGAIHPVAELKTYAQARRAEANRDYPAAISAYRECQNFFDSASRVVNLLMSGVSFQTAAPTAEPAKTAAPAAVTAPPQTQQTPLPTLTLTARSQNEVNTLSWNALPGAESYILKRRLGAQAPSQVYAGSAASYTDNSVIGNYTYVYVVTARLPGGVTIESNEVSVLTSQSGWSSPTAVPVTNPPTARPATNPPTAVPVQWSAWSQWSTTPVSSSATRQVETEERTEPTYKTVYQYSRYRYIGKNGNAWYAAYDYSGTSNYLRSGAWQYNTTETPLAKERMVSHANGSSYQLYAGSWYNETVSQVEDGTVTVTYYRYRDRTN